MLALMVQRAEDLRHKDNAGLIDALARSIIGYLSKAFKKKKK